MTTANNKKIAQNSILLYIRMLFNMIITFYTSRVVLETLGVEDFGVYGVVGGIIAMFGFLNSCMSSATSRFLTYELGKGNNEQLKEIFSAALTIHIVIAILIFILGETLGLWWLENKLILDPDRMYAARWVYHLSLFTALINITQVPYNATIIAHERMNVYAYVEILNSSLKLGIAYFLTISPFDKLIIYAFLILGTTLIISTIYKIYCTKYFSESHYQFHCNAKIFKPMLNFSGWELFGNFANVANSQGSNILLNLFFGVILNAAYGISNQVYGALGQFINSFQLAVNPQIVKSYANGNLKHFFYLIYKSCRLSYLIMLIPIVGIIYNVDYILKLWLNDPPNYSSIFVTFILLDAMINSLAGPLVIAEKATGKIKYYQIIVGILLFLNLPISYFCFLKYQEPIIMFETKIVLSFITLCYRIYFLKRFIGLSIKEYIHTVFAKIIYPTVIIFILLYIMKYNVGDAKDLFTFTYQTIILTFTTIMITFTLGLTKSEKSTIINKLKRYPVIHP